MPLRRVFLTGAFRFSLVYIAIIFSGLTYLQQLTGVTEQDIFNWFSSNEAEELATAARRLLWIIVPMTILAACLIAWLVGILVTVIRFYNFKLRRLDNKLIRSYGLLTLQEATIPLKRIQALVVRSNPLMRAFKWFRLELQTIGHGTEERGGRMAIPLAKQHELEEVGPQIKPFTLPDTYERVSRITIRRTFIRYTLGLLVVVTPTSFLFWSGAWWGLTLLPLLAYMAWLQYLNHGYAFEEDTLYIRRGVMRQYIWIVPAERFQAFQVNGTLFQRRLGLRTVSVDTAGASYIRFPRIVDLPTAIAEKIADQLYAGLRRSVTLPVEPEQKPQTEGSMGQ